MTETSRFLTRSDGAIDMNVNGAAPEVSVFEIMPVLNKADLEQDPIFGVVDERLLAVHRVSAVTGEGIEQRKYSLFELIPEAPTRVETSSFVGNDYPKR